MAERDQSKKTEGTYEEAAEGGLVWVHCPEHGMIIGVFQQASGQWICPKEHDPSWGGPVDHSSRTDGSRSFSKGR